MIPSLMKAHTDIGKLMERVDRLERLAILNFRKDLEECEACENDRIDIVADLIREHDGDVKLPE